MKIPNKVKVGPHWYDVIFSRDIARQGDVAGSIHHVSSKIFIDPDNSKNQQEDSFIHELLHACMFVSGLAMRFEEKSREALPTEEQVVRELATILYGVIQDNPEIFKTQEATPGKRAVKPKNGSKPIQRLDRL